MSRLNRLLLILHLFVGLGAIFGGMTAILNPTEPLGISVDALKNSPFDDYLIPGIILFTVVGLGNMISAVTLIFKSKYQGYISSVFTWGVVIWIIVQIIMLRGVHFLHVLYFSIGLAGAVLSARMMFEQELFPTKLILQYYKKITKGM